MPFNELPEGQTHSENDGCGMPEHNPMPPIEQRKCCEKCPGGAGGHTEPCVNVEKCGCYNPHYSGLSNVKCVRKACPCHTPTSPKSEEWERELGLLDQALGERNEALSHYQYTNVLSLLSFQAQKFTEEKRAMVERYEMLLHSSCKFCVEGNKKIHEEFLP